MAVVVAVAVVLVPFLLRVAAMLVVVGVVVVNGVVVVVLFLLLFGHAPLSALLLDVGAHPVGLFVEMRKRTCVRHSPCIVHIYKFQMLPVHSHTNPDLSLWQMYEANRLAWPFARPCGAAGQPWLRSPPDGPCPFSRMHER